MTVKNGGGHFELESGGHFKLEFAIFNLNSLNLMMSRPVLCGHERSDYNLRITWILHLIIRFA
jgi:hypothetical protein